MLLSLLACIVTAVIGANVNYYVLFNGADGKNSLQSSFVVNKTSTNTVFDALKGSVDLYGKDYQFTAEYYQTYKYFIKCISTVCDNVSTSFYFSFWLNGVYSCKGVSDTVLSETQSNNVQMIYSNANITCPPTSDSYQSHNKKSSKNQDFKDAINVTYTIIFGSNLQRTSIISGMEPLKGIDVMETAVDIHGASYQFIAVYFQSYGFLIDCIDGICSNDETKQYWFLYVNNNQTAVGISNIQVAVGDVLTWKYEVWNGKKMRIPV